jgi:ATP-dependent helicase/nuclease subunit B
MQRFLDKVSHHILTHYPDDISRLCIVLPNRRAGLFLKKSLPEMAGKTIWSPDIFSVEDFCVQISGYNLSDPIGLLFRFYDIHRQLEADQAQSFDDFIQWAQVLLSDFNEIDQHMVDAKALFHYLTEAKAIEKWSPENPHLSETVKGYLRFYRSLFDYYTALRENAEKNRQGWQGLIFRHVAENIETIATGLKWKRIIFAGFNALTVAEKKITTTLTQMGMAEMLWDADSYYLDDTNQEAGIFLRKIMRETGKQQFRWVEDNFREIEKKITICGVPKNLGQAGYAAQVVQQWNEQIPQTTGARKPVSALSNAALVLADESLLFPVLSSLNDDTQEFNVTMGFPVKFTTTFQFFNLLFRLYENAERFLSVGGGKSKGFYFTDLLNLFSHPYSRRLLDATLLISVVKKSNRVFYSPEHMTELITTCSNPPEQLFAQLFKTSQVTPQLLLEIFSFVIELLKQTFIREKSNPKKLLPLKLSWSICITLPKSTAGCRD